MTDAHTVILTDVVALTDPVATPEVAMIVATPPWIEVTNPMGDTVAIFSSELAQVTVA